MKPALAIACILLSAWLYWHFKPLPKEHPPEIIALMEFYKQAAKEQPAD